jgi:hypothetical protein
VRDHERQQADPYHHDDEESQPADQESRHEAYRIGL